MRELAFTLWLLGGVSCIFECKAQDTAGYPNIVLILADDLGYGDIGCYGSKDIHTPHLDNLAKEGVSFTSFYANGPSCTPTRTALLTGRYQQRVGGLECPIGVGPEGEVGRYPEAAALCNQGELGLPVAFNALPMILNQKGYNTALIGKWHLGENPKFSPVAHGFDYSIGPSGGLVDYFRHTGSERRTEPDLYRDGERHYREGYYMTHLITDESVEWINIQNEETPFFLYVPYTAPHVPLQGPDDYTMENRTGGIKDGSHETYARMIEDMDEGIGKILAKLDEKGFAENTLVIFFSDNGPIEVGSAGPFSGNKASLFEGGIRVPCVIKWPGKIKMNSSTSQMAISMDLTASITQIVNGNPPRPLDGFDIIGHIASGAEDFPRTLYWRKIRGENIFKAVRDDHLKYIRNDYGGEVSEYLFDLSSDPAEKNNLKDRRKKDLKRLQKKLERWEQEVKPERYMLAGS